MLTLALMGMRVIRRVVFVLILSGCAAAVPESKPAPDALVWNPEAPFAREEKTTIPPEAAGLFHFLKGNLLLGQGEFDEALGEFEAAARAKIGRASCRERVWSSAGKE